MKDMVYELAYHLNPDIDEAQAGQVKQMIEDAITSKGGVIVFRKEPEKTRLSYAIDHHGAAYFGYIHFTPPAPESLKEIEDHIKLDTNILRYLVIKVPAQSAQRRMPSMMRPRRPRAMPEKTQKPAVPAPTPAQEKEIEKQLEDVIGKL